MKVLVSILFLALGLNVAACNATNEPTLQPLPQATFVSATPLPPTRSPQPTSAPKPTSAPTIAKTPVPQATRAPASTAAPATAPGTGGVTPPQPRASNTITIDSPQVADAVANPAQISGKIAVTPFENNLVYRVYSTSGDLVGQGPLQVQGEMGQPGIFAGDVEFDEDVAGPGRIYVLDLSAADGAIIGSAVADVYLGMDSAPESKPKPEVLAARRITIAAPLRDAAVSSGFTISGAVSVAPFENTLAYRVFDTEGVRIGQGTLAVKADIGKPGTFEGKIQYLKSAQGPGHVEVLDVSAADGFIVGSAAVDVIFGK